MSDLERELQSAISRNISIVSERISKAAGRAGRDPGEISLVAVTKKKNPLVIKTLVENGITRIGESYVQEATFKIDLLKELPAEWHMIGPVQRGKEKSVAMSFSAVHSVDRVDLAKQLNAAAEQFGKVLGVYLEFNTSGEATKHGWPAWEPSRWEEMLPDIEEILSCRSLAVRGLMTMAPYHDDPEYSRPYFRKLRELGEYFQGKFKEAQLDGLSMGMSGDFEIAVEEGATILRIGTALVGPR